MEIHLIITFTAKPEKRAAFADLLDRVRDELPQVPGCNGVRAFNSAADPDVFTLLETWESVRHHQTHIEKVVRSGAWDHIASHLSTEPASAYYGEL